MFTLYILQSKSLNRYYVGYTNNLERRLAWYNQTELFYWHREALNSNAEVDYLIQKNNGIVPIEVKSGIKGSMNSMYLFLNEKKSKYGCRLSLENFAEYENIKVYPLYAYTNVIG